jgi:hypothetical protein
MKAFFTACSFCCAVVYSSSAQAVSEVSITAERVEHPQADVQQLAIKLKLQKTDVQFSINSAIKQKAEKTWTQLSLECELPRQQVSVKCVDGLLKSERLNIPFDIKFSRLYAKNQLDIDATLQFKNASFSDEAGLHAAEKLNGPLARLLKPAAEAWLWRSALDWQSGEVFWQPFYVANGGHQFTASGKLENELLTFNNAHLKVKDVGELNANGQLSLKDFKILNMSAELPHLNLNTAYPMFFKPLLEKTAFANAEVSGVAAIKFEFKNTAPRLFELLLNDVDIADKNDKFAFYKVNANIPWDYDAARNVSFAYDSGALLNLPLGKTKIQAQVDRYSLTAPSIKLPILDGALNLTNISASRKADQWYWHLGAKLEPISMEDFSTHLKLPKMRGKASAEIPLVTYAAGLLTADGSILLNVFDGTATLTELTMQSPLGIAPKLNANIALRNLDLGVLTSTFSFGAIEGKLDGDIKDLELQNWKPVKFDAIVQSSPGKYPKKISQRAVENITALGGGGAAAAVQRSFLRFFEQFNYGKMGLSCRLRNDICEMGGVESTPQGYIIVKGSGIPAITVMGYNKTVGWSELLSRIKRVTDGNTKAIVQ